MDVDGDYEFIESNGKQILVDKKNQRCFHKNGARNGRAGWVLLPFIVNLVFVLILSCSIVLAYKDTDAAGIRKMECGVTSGSLRATANSSTMAKGTRLTQTTNSIF